ncbi:MAG: class I SAM-dependent methyltransferase [Candidatus Baltobacteraceae bacterium]
MIQRYLEEAHPPPHPLLVELEAYGRDDDEASVARETGRFLSTIVTAMQANRILEVGTAYGYATLWMALAQPRVGKIWTVDPDARRTEVARSFFQRAGEDDYIEVFNTPPLELLENFPHRNLDVVFIASGKSAYRAYLDLAIPMLKLSGVAIVNDCLTDVPATGGFNEYFLAHPALDATVLPFGGGVGIGARRL